MPTSTPLEYLEYDEQDDDNLFGSDPEDVQAVAGPSTSAPLPIYNTARQLGAQAAGLIPAPSPAGSSKGKERAQVKDPQDRLDELRFMRLPKPSMARSAKGVRSLKDTTMFVIRQNSTRIWDIGDLEYRVIADFLNELPMEQLTEVEANSPHIRKETDWLWEYFLLQDHPMFYDQCREKGGQTRASGWRRMYKKALEDAQNRKVHAADRMQQRYKELEEAKQARRVVLVDKITMPAKGKAARGRQGGMLTVRAGQPRPAGMSSGSAAPKGIFGKARAEAQRAKVAMTHASGKFDPRVANRQASISRPPSTAPKTFENPWALSDQQARKVVDGPRIPASRGIRTSGKRIREEESPEPIPLPGARPVVPQRSGLPQHLDSRLISASTSSTGERFKLDSQRLAPIKRPRVENFEPPRAPTTGLNLNGGPTSLPMGTRPTPGRISSPAKRPSTADEAARLNSLLFVKKKPSRPKQPAS